MKNKLLLETVRTWLDFSNLQRQGARGEPPRQDGPWGGPGRTWLPTLRGAEHCPRMGERCTLRGAKPPVVPRPTFKLTRTEISAQDKQLFPSSGGETGTFPDQLHHARGSPWIPPIRPASAPGPIQRREAASHRQDPGRNKLAHVCGLPSSPAWSQSLRVNSCARGGKLTGLLAVSRTAPCAKYFLCHKNNYPAAKKSRPAITVGQVRGWCVSSCNLDVWPGHETRKGLPRAGTAALHRQSSHPRSIEPLSPLRPQPA